MPYFLALDIGGTKTDYLLADETSELARVRTGTIKRMRTDASTAAANLDQALAELTALTGVSMRAIARTCIGTAGETVPLVTNWLREAFAARVSGDLLLLGDVEIALDAAFHGNIGVLAMAGTGSNVAGRMPDGTLITAGGWGPELADQGSGHKIGREGAARRLPRPRRTTPHHPARRHPRLLASRLHRPSRRVRQLPPLPRLLPTHRTHPPLRQRRRRRRR